MRSVCVHNARDEEGKARIRIAAESVANRKTRVALATIAEGELESAAIEEAMEDDLSRSKKVKEEKKA